MAEGMAARGGADDRAGLAARADPASGGAGDMVRVPPDSKPEPLASRGPDRLRMTVGEARVRRARIIVISATVAGCAAILLMSRGFNFYFDEWDFILAAPDWTLLSYLQPHNEHPSLIPKLVYGILLNTAGLRTYVPYMVVLMLLHGAAAVLIWYLVLGRSGTPSNPPPTASNILLTPGYAVWGIGAAAAGLVGEGGWAAPVALVLGGASIGWTWWRRRPDAFALGAAAALVTFYLITAVSRAQFGYQQAGAGRYVYEGAVLWLLLLG